MTRIVTSVPRPKRPPKKRKAVALDVPAIVTVKRSRHPLRAKQAAAQVMSRPNPTEAPQPSTPRDSERDPIASASKRSAKPTSEPQAATSLHGETPSAIVTSLSRKRARQRRAGYTPAEAEPDHDPPDDTLMQAMARMIRPPGAG